MGEGRSFSVSNVFFFSSPGFVTGDLGSVSIGW